LLVRAEEVGEVVHADGELAAAGNREVGPDAGRRLDRAGVQRAVHDAHRLMVVRAGVDVPADAAAAAGPVARVSVDHQAQGLHERAQGHIGKIKLRH